MEQYDPWTMYARTDWDAEQSRPYESLFELLRSTGAFLDETSFTWRLECLEPPSCLFGPNQEGSIAEKILDWCSRFGLLGILPHIAVAIDLPRRFGPQVDERLFFDRAYSRVNGKWKTHICADAPFYASAYQSLNEEMNLIELEDPSSMLGPMVSPGHERYRRPRILLSRTASPRSEPPLEEILKKHFPGLNPGSKLDWNRLAGQFECPRPLSPEFWRIYSEPVVDFLAHALEFVNIIWQLSNPPGTADLSRLEWFLEPAGVGLSVESDRSMREQWICPSLLSSFARMALQDHVSGMRVQLCDSCHRTFVTGSYQGRYCTQACAWRHRKRRARARKSKEGLRVN